MIGPVYLAADFASAILKLLPRGLVWPRDSDAEPAQLANALAPTYARNSADAIGLLNDAPPFALDQMLTEWEMTLGLPDPCAGNNQSVQQRVAQVISKLKFSGGQSVPYFLGLATSLGFPGTTITEYAPFRAGRSHAGDPLYSAGWAFSWLVTSPNTPVFYFSAGISVAGDPLYDLGGEELRCTFNRYKPAHTTALYAGHA